MENVQYVFKISNQEKIFINNCHVLRNTFFTRDVWIVGLESNLHAQLAEKTFLSKIDKHN